MLKSLKEFFLEACRDYTGQLWRFWIILYGATIISELLRQELLKGLVVRFGLDLRPILASNLILKEFSSNPLLALLFTGVIFFTLWGFASLYFSFSGRSLVQSVVAGFKNIGRYFGFVVAASVITLLGLVIINIPVLTLLDAFTNIPVYLVDGETLNFWVMLPIILALGIPGIYLLVAFSSAPFILLLEKRNIWESLGESRRRVTPYWWRIATKLFLTFIVSGIAYFILNYFIFSLKLAFIPDLSFRGELLLKVFIYSIPWIVVASFYDFILYRLYLGISSAGQNPTGESTKQSSSIYSVQEKLSKPLFSVRTLKGIAIVTLVAFLLLTIVFPLTTQAGGGGLIGGVVGLIFGIILSVICVPCAPLAIVGLTSLTVTVTVTSALVGSLLTTSADLLIGSQTCSGSYDPVFGTCTKEDRRQENQQIFNTAGAKFEEIAKGGIPSPEEFSKNPDAKEKVTIEWISVGRPGTINIMTVRDKMTDELICSTQQNSCSSGTMTDVCVLPYEKTYRADIIFASCWQIAAKEVRPTCSGCGGDTSGAKKEFTTSSLPLPKADIKANGKDSAVFTPGKPVTLSWISEYALSCSAEDGWSGAKSTSGSQTFVPTSANDKFTIACRRGDKIGRDSVSSETPAREINIFNGGSGGVGTGGGGGGTGGGGGGLRISQFNASEPLNPGDKITLNWSVQNATSCEVDNGIGQIPTVGSVQVTFLREVTFNMTCRDDTGNTVTAQRTVKVKKIPPFKEIVPE